MTKRTLLQLLSRASHAALCIATTVLPESSAGIPIDQCALRVGVGGAGLGHGLLELGQRSQRRSEKAPPVDRVLHHCIIVNSWGNIYRIRLYEVYGLNGGMDRGLQTSGVRHVPSPLEASHTKSGGVRQRS